MSAKQWMMDNHGEHIDPETGILCTTTLAEDCAQTLYGRAAEEREFEIAFEIADTIDGERESG